MSSLVSLVLATGLHGAVLAASGDATAGWHTTRLDGDFRAEGCALGDLDRDGEVDLVAGSSWYRGPQFRERREIREPKTFDPAGYSDRFLDFVHDLDGDGWNDVLTVGFPGEAAHWYRNPCGADRRWERFLVLEQVDNESPTFADLTGDGRPELVCQQSGRFGWAEPDPRDPERPWTFHALSPVLDLGKFTHGLGVGDVDGDGRTDLLERTGWWRQPQSLAGDPLWEKHAVTFGTQGGAQMFAYDIDGDRDADVLTSLAAHGFGLAWFEQVRDASGAISFREHLFVGDDHAQSPHGVRFSEIHALTLCDLDGDGLQDLVTGKRWWSHGAQGDPEPGAPAVVYAFRLARGVSSGVDFVPQLVHAASGVGVQLAAARRPDGSVVVATCNKQGTFVHVLGDEVAEPIQDAEGARPRGPDGRVLNLDLESGDLSDWTATGDAFAGQPIDGDTVRARGREPSLHAGRYWIGGWERHGDDRVGTLTSAAFRISEPWASFLVGGGGGIYVRAEIVGCDSAGQPAGEVLYRTGGADFESMQRVVADLSGHVGELACVRLTDEAKGHWGHVNFDDLRLHARRPFFERPEGVPEILSPDPVHPAGLAPEAAARAMSVPDGFQVELVASEPDLHQPIAFTFDSKGRLWVAEAFTYPRRAAEGEGRDDILVFEDRDGDGRFETRTTFASGLNLVSGLEVGFGGAWVGAAPFLLFIPDRDDDLSPDGPPEVLLDGWGYEDTHETLNAFTWGPDGWLYGCHGVFTHSRVGKPGTPDEERVPINAGVWRFHPTRGDFEVFAWGTSNPWGLDFDDRGQAFATACVIPHLYHVIQGARYIRQSGAHFDPYHYGELDTIADHRHYLGSSPHGGNLRSDGAGGGHAHSGAAIYLGGAFPASYRGALFMSNIHGNRLNQDRLERAGSGFVGRHAEDFLLANDRWFRAVATKVGPDGALYLIDWYDAQACHLNDPGRWDRSNGRLYRVSYGPNEPVAVDLPALPSEKLVALQLHANDWWVRRARLVLQERGPDKEVHAWLRSILRHNRESDRRLRALWALHATGGLDEQLALSVLADRDEDLEAWTVQLALERGEPSPRMSAVLVKVAAQSSSSVTRLYLASALQRLPDELCWTIASQLVRHAEDAGDANIPWMIWWGIEPLVAADPGRALGLARTARIPLVAECIARRVAEDSGVHESLAQALVLEADAARRKALLTGFERALRGRRGVAAPPSWAVAWDRLAADPDAEVRELALSLAAAFADPAALPRLRATLADPQAGTGQRERAIERLSRARDEEAVPLFLALLDDPELCVPALRGLSAFSGERIPRAALERYARFAPAARRETVALLAVRVEWARALLDAVDRGEVGQAEVHAAVLRSLRALDDAEIARRMEARWGKVRSTAGDKETRIVALKSELTPAALARAELHRGRGVYEATCGQCHELFGSGRTLGPDLTGSNRADLDYLLENVLDPSAVVGQDYLETLVWLKDGRMLSGVARRATGGMVELQTQHEALEIPREEIEELRESGLSAMPEGLIDALTAEDVRDLVAYLSSPAQVERLATAADVLFDGRTLAGWRGDAGVWSIENGEIVGRTAGLARNEFLASELALRDFRLTLEVKLSGDQGNSGIQFRSRALAGGDIAGYQADIGAGWWGKLYEEHGRGVLAEGAGEERVLRDGWNTYEIAAVGSRVRLSINGTLGVELDDPGGARSGILALQVHSGGPTEVRFRNLRLELDPPAPSQASR